MDFGQLFVPLLVLLCVVSLQRIGVVHLMVTQINLAGLRLEFHMLLRGQVSVHVWTRQKVLLALFGANPLFLLVVVLILVVSS